MDYSTLSIRELEALMMEQEVVIQQHKDLLNILADFRIKACKMEELQRKLGNLGSEELEMIKKLAQSASVASIDSAEDVKL
jgi:hypothetical protein